ncbi:MAG: DUF4178 domain-containing protein [Bdellovibrionaceae bacterium]|nr:DUF4178 domain-containing protein [Pseudobdellovibrionaceae bacterium]
MDPFLCPQCGATLKYTSSFAVSTVCEYCRSLVVRHDKNIELWGKEADLQDDLNPLQIGTRGTYQKTGFTIAGGVRLNHHEGFWHEWFLQLDQPVQNSNYAWLVQAQGEYQFLLEPLVIPPPLSREVGAVVDVPNEIIKKIGVWSAGLLRDQDAFKIVDIRTAGMSGFVGQLPWAPDRNRQRMVAELASTGDLKLTVEFGIVSSQLYYGQVLYFEDFKFENLKEIKGW